MMKAKMLIPIILVLLILAGIARAAPAPGLEISRYVVAGGGGRLEQSSYALDFTVGQSVVGTASQTPYELCAGFWCTPGGEPIDHEIFLPLVMR